MFSSLSFASHPYPLEPPLDLKSLESSRPAGCLISQLYRLSELVLIRVGVGLTQLNPSRLICG